MKPKFIKIYNEVIIGLPALSGPAIKVLLSSLGWKNNNHHQSRGTIAKRTGSHVRCITDGIAELKKHDFIKTYAEIVNNQQVGQRTHLMINLPSNDKNEEKTHFYIMLTPDIIDKANKELTKQQLVTFLYLAMKFNRFSKKGYCPASEIAAFVGNSITNAVKLRSSLVKKGWIEMFENDNKWFYRSEHFYTVKQNKGAIHASI